MNKTSDLKKWRRNYYLANRDKQKAQSKAYKELHPEKEMQRYAVLKKLIFEHYGNKCSCPKCPETNPMFLTIDHINNDGAKLRKSDSNHHNYRWIIKNNFPTYLRLMCWNCNSGRYHNGGVCPHLSSC